MRQGAVEIEVLLAGQITAPRGYVVRAPGSPVARLQAGLIAGRQPTLSLPVISYVLRHPTAGLILIDTGLHADAHRQLRGDFGAAMSLLFRGLTPVGEPFEEQLRTRGVDPATVTRVIMTHLHVDHTSGMRALPNARFVCARAEWTAACARGAWARGYVRRHLPPPQRMELVDLAGDGEPFGPFAHTLDLLGDGSLRLIATPGHTPGHLSVLIARGDGDAVLAAGDAAYTLTNIRDEVLPMITADDRASRNTLRELRMFSTENPRTLIVPSHDPDAWRALAGEPPRARPLEMIGDAGP